MKIQRIDKIYEALRETNPWLPPAEFVSASRGIDIHVAMNQIPTVTLELFIAIPPMLTGHGIDHLFEEDGSPEGTEEPEEQPRDKEYSEFSQEQPESFKGDGTGLFTPSQKGEFPAPGGAEFTTDERW